MSSDCATIVDEILSPSALIEAALGPINAMGGSQRDNFSGNFGFSDACPQPAQTAYL